MRVLMLSKALVVGAYQRKLEELASLPDVELIAAVPPAWREGKRVTHLERLHLRGYDLQALHMSLNGHYHLHWYPGLRALLRRYRPDILHIDEEPYNVATAHAVWLARQMNIRCLFFSWQNLARRYPPPFRWLEGYCYARVQGAIAGNEEAAQVLRAKGFSGPLTVIPQFGVDPSIFARDAAAPVREHDGNFRLGFAGRLVEEKGLLVLLAALEQLPSIVTLDLAGSGPLEPRLRQMIDARGWQQRVRLVGPVPSGHMPAFINGLDVLMLPSLTRDNWKEQFGRVLVEAMSCAVPVIGSTSGEIPLVIGDAGLVCPEGDAQRLATAIRELMDHPEFCLELGKRGRARVLQHFTHRRVAEETWSFYRRIREG